MVPGNTVMTTVTAVVRGVVLPHEVGVQGGEDGALTNPRMRVVAGGRIFKADVAAEV